MEVLRRRCEGEFHTHGGGTHKVVARTAGRETVLDTVYVYGVKRGGAVVAVRCPEPTAPPEQLRDTSGGRGDAAVLVLLRHRVHHMRYYACGHLSHVGW